MSRVSFDPADFYSPVTGFVEVAGSPRLGEITDAVARYHQWQASKSTGEQQPPLTAVFLSLLPIDEHGNALSAEDVEQELVAHWGDWQRPLPAIRPGRMESRESESADMAENGNLTLGAEGNCLFAENDSRLSSIAPWCVCLKSLVALGFPAEILRMGYLPDLVGLRARWDLKPRQYTDKAGMRRSATDFVAVEIVRLPSTQPAPVPIPAPAKRGRAVAVREKPAQTVAAGVNAAPAPPSSNGFESALLGLLSQISAKCAGQTLNRKQIFVWVMQLATADEATQGLYQPIVDLLNGKGADAWLAAHAAQFNAVAAPGGGFLMAG